MTKNNILPLLGLPATRKKGFKWATQSQKGISRLLIENAP